MDRYEFALRLVSIIAITIILLLDILYWKIDHALIMTLAFLIGLLAGIRFRKIVIAPEGGE